MSKRRSTNDRDATDPLVMRAAVQVVASMGEIIREAGEEGVRADLLYALTSEYFGWKTFNLILAALSLEHVITRDAYDVLKWVGPDPLHAHRFVASVFPSGRCALCDGARIAAIHQIDLRHEFRARADRLCHTCGKSASDPIHC